MTWLVMAVGEDGQGALGMGSRQLRLRSGPVEKMLASVELQSW
jgi:hypothetical protein